MAQSTDTTWLTLFGAALSGGLVSSVIDHLVSGIRSHRSAKRTAKDIVNAHLDPLLKAADAVVGKTISLAERDFIPLTTGQAADTAHPASTDLIGLAYLYANLWGRIEILTKESLGVSLSSDPRGKKLVKFITCIESQRVRLVNRTHQKAVGETTTEVLGDGGMRTIGVVEFGEKLATVPSTQSWCHPLIDLLGRTRDKAVRQKLLIYGVALHALVDTLDPEHHSTHKRSSYPNKLSKESKRRIEHLVFREYLKGTGATNRYAKEQ